MDFSNRATFLPNQDDSGWQCLTGPTPPAPQPPRASQSDVLASRGQMPLWTNWRPSRADHQMMERHAVANGLPSWLPCPPTAGNEAGLTMPSVPAPAAMMHPVRGTPLAMAPDGTVLRCPLCHCELTSPGVSCATCGTELCERCVWTCLSSHSAPASAAAAPQPAVPTYAEALRPAPAAQRISDSRCFYCDCARDGYTELVLRCATCHVDLCPECAWKCTLCGRPACGPHVPHPECRGQQPPLQLMPGEEEF